ncbi:ester cyclase [Variovorax sp. J2P1-59]|uniref:ester cyclase n=1 Tax=Variovorax flavidus TaxID=3053501 RepID=UPI0025754A7D|nr:ester cyclase [Variovorax sp. J2P1-59]MDM0075472.1 ester cyclase [Variovorax sp. J2P1-59]
MMNPASTTGTALAAPPARFDIYAQVHKGLRACMAASLVETGRMDSSDDPSVKCMLDNLDQLLDWCAGHLQKENQFVHPAIEARNPAACSRMAEEHAHHEASIAQLRESIDRLSRAGGAAREAAATRLYRQLAVFVADNLAHMETEESVNNAILWAGYADVELAELAELHAAIVAATSPSQLAVDVRWITPHLRPSELAALMRGLQASMPPDVFASVAAMVGAHLPPQRQRRLAAELGLPVPAPQAEPLAIVQRFIDAAFVRFDARAAAQCVTPDFVAHPWAAFGLPPGPAALEVVVPWFGNAFDEASAELADPLIDGDRVALRYTYAARHVGDLFGIAATGRRFRIEGICIVRLAGGRVAEYWREEDMLGLQRQLGVPTLLPAEATTA